MRPIGLLLLLLAALAAACEIQPSATGPFQGRNPLEEQLRPPAGVERREGVAAAVLMDTSGSMEEGVAGADGNKVEKIVIARRAVTSLVRQFEEYAQKNPGRAVVVGVYEFSTRDSLPHCRVVIPIGPPDSQAASEAVERMVPAGGTPIGDAMILAKRDLDRWGMTRRHMLVITDGKNNKGYSPGAVADVLSRQDEADRAAVYFIAFDIEAERFSAVKEAGGLVMAAANERDLNQTIDFILTGKILAEQPQ